MLVAHDVVQQYRRDVACIYITAHYNYVLFLHPCALGLSDFEFFWNFKNRHPARVVGFNSKTKIEKAFFDILRNYRVLRKTFFQKLLHKVRNFFLSKYDFMGIKKSVILWRFQKVGHSLVTKCTLNELFTKNCNFPQKNG